VLFFGFLKLKLLPVAFFQNGGCIQNGGESIFLFHTIFSKMLIWHPYFNLFWVKLKLSWNFFS
jgi:hypothetical protein